MTVALGRAGLPFSPVNLLFSTAVLKLSKLLAAQLLLAGGVLKLSAASIANLLVTGALSGVSIVNRILAAGVLLLLSG